MRLLLSAILLMTCITGNAQIPPAIQWQKCYGGTASDAIAKMAPTPDGGYILCGYSMSNDGDMGANYGIVDALVMKIDASGNIQWRKNYGSTQSDYAYNIIATADGGYIFVGTAGAGDMDVTGYHPGVLAGLRDIWVVKINNVGTIQWQQCYGGPGDDIAWDIIQATGGGYLVAASTKTSGGDIGALHGMEDLWIFRIDAMGVLQWQRPYGGTLNDGRTAIIPTSDGGYILGCFSNSHDGDISCTTVRDGLWLAKLDNAGSIQWQTCLTDDFVEWLDMILQTTDGGYILVGGGSIWGAPPLPNVGEFDAFAIKLDAAGNMQWRHTLGGTDQERFSSVIQTPDGAYVMAGGTLSTDGDICINKGNCDFFIVKLNSDGTTNWIKTCGGSTSDYANDILPTPDGGYLVGGITDSNNGDVSGNHSNYTDGWLVKLSFPGVPIIPTINIVADKTTICPGESVTFVAAVTNAGNAPIYQWQVNGINTGPNNDTITISTLNNGDIVSCVLTSNSRCVTDPTAASNTITITFSGVLLPAINIVADKTTICTGQSVTFVAAITDGGNAPIYQWKVNGINTGPSNDTIMISTLNNGDIVSCVLTSNSPCVANPTTTSNTIAIAVDLSQSPVGFLFADTAVCRFGTIDLKATGSFNSYLWNNNAVTPTITIAQPGQYWLQVTNSTGCQGRDTVIVTQKECLQGFYMPTAFTPNNDGKNDLLKPLIFGKVEQYKFTIINRWGQVVFQTTDTEKGWNGKFKGLVQDGNVYVWTCSYQLSGEKLKLAKGTFVLIH